jgi:hypothetical protein
MQSSVQKFEQVLVEGTIKDVCAFCSNNTINLNSPLDLFVKIEDPENLTCRIRNFTVSPLEFAIDIDNPHLAKVLCRYGADPNFQDLKLFYKVIQYGRYKFLPIFLEYGLKYENHIGENLLHIAVDSCNENTVQEMIAACILLFGKQMLDEKNFKEQLIPLEYAQQKQNETLIAQKAFEILNDTKLLMDKIEKVEGEFTVEKAKEKLEILQNTLGIDLFSIGREIGMSVGEMYEQKYFLQRNNQLNSKEEKE